MKNSARYVTKTSKFRPAKPARSFFFQYITSKLTKSVTKLVKRLPFCELINEQTSGHACANRVVFFLFNITRHKQDEKIFCKKLAQALRQKKPIG